jgi:hypothetical protein
MAMEWRKEAACTGVTVDIFYPKRGGSNIPAMRICWGDEDNPPCPVRLECLNWACTYTEEADRHGIFGGLTAPQRRKYRRSNKAAIKKPVIPPKPKPQPRKAPARKKKTGKKLDYWKNKRCYLTGLNPDNPRYIPPVKEIKPAPIDRGRYGDGFYGGKRSYLTGFEHEGLT